jgi:uncharacterized protein (TIGR03437 family)
MRQSAQQTLAQVTCFAVTAIALCSTAVYGQSAKPVVKSIVNAASYSSGPVAPGEIVVIFGSSLGPSILAGLVLDAAGRVATTLSGTQVFFDGIPAPLLYVSQSQLSAVVPFGLAGKAATQVQVVTGGNVSDSIQNAVTLSAPGIFSTDSSGTGQVAATNSTGSINSSSQPTSPGSYITVYMTGAGVMTIPNADGSIALSTSNVVLPVSVFVAGRTAQVLYAGAAPGNVFGLCQINVAIPPDLPYGGSLPLTVQVGTANSQTTATIAVSGESTPVLLPPSNVQAFAINATQVKLTWDALNTSATQTQIERKSGASSAYGQIGTVQTNTNSYQDAAVQSAMTYTYRLRSQGLSSVSAFSYEAVATTPALAPAVPAAPTNLQATSASSTKVNLSWTNNATSATGMRLEYSSANPNNFYDIGLTDTLTTTSVTNLEAGTTYTFRLRAQNSAGYSAYSHLAAATTFSITTVFLIHGLDQGPSDLNNFAANLAAPYGLSAGHFRIDSGFDFSDCADKTLAVCSSACTISGGAQRLAQYIVNARPPGDIVLIGFSLGGLLARDLIVNSRIILNGRKIDLVTIGTPNGGYPYLASDSLVFCSAVVSAMSGDWRSQPGSIVLSTYLSSLTKQWSAYGFPGGSGRTWFAASGRAVSTPSRLGTGCRDQNPYSDGVVCQDSAGYNVSTSAGTQPNSTWADPNAAYVHSTSGWTALILGDTSNMKYMKLWDPPPAGALFNTLTAVLNGL